MAYQYEVWKEEVWPALKSKKEEFEILGYGYASEEDIWESVIEKLNKNKTEPRIHSLVNGILTYRLTEYMNRITISSYREGAGYSTEADFEELLGDIENHSSQAGRD
ncbi:post-transcriptional regulator [Alteribacillus sp. HJP-4]|uniref:post-transcriptional regulator n=1 Tax=Alteribacillus sp. HJP-4 TaxID=2775394 RepID=UPI0035CCD126